MTNRWAIAFAGGVGAAVLTGLVTRLTRSAPVLKRENHKGEPVSLSEGTGVATALIGSAVARRDFAAAAALTATANAGLADDYYDLFAPENPPKGLHGHLEALKQGHVSTGAVKVVVIGLAGSGYAAAHAKRYNRGFYDWVIDSIIVTGSANIANLFDLRPGRALKASTACALLASSARVSPRSLGATLGTIAGAARTDLSGETMLGDVGANPLGLQVGMLAVVPGSRAFRTIMAALTLGVIGAGEVVSFSSVIEGNRVLRAIDQFGVKNN